MENKTITFKVNGKLANSDIQVVATVTVNKNKMTRLAGDTRYDTMSRIVDEGGWRTGGTVVVASGSNYPDALAASGLAGVLDAPVVLTDGDVLSAQAADRVRALAPSRIVVAGGPAAVSDRALASLRVFVFNVM